ncbi:hypothetical protein A2U01_0113534, partial [Trifolium medium]|nr:hypothetical protein [Trifolium medium]
MLRATGTADFVLFLYYLANRMRHTR